MANKGTETSDEVGGEIVTSDDLPVSSQFRGVFYHSLDEKGRVSFPAEFRRVLRLRNQNAVVLTNFVTDGARCLEGYTLDAWTQLERRVAERSRFDPQVKKFENFYLARAAVCSIDGSGRLNIVSHLRQYAGLEREIAFTSSLHGFRLWDRRVWDLVFQESEAALLENPAMFLGIDKPEGR